MILTNLLLCIGFGILIYYMLLMIWYTFLLVVSIPELLTKFNEAKYGNILQLMSEDNIIPITIVTPAFNESKRILNMLYSVLQSDYKNVNVIIVNDGSTDNMMEFLRKELYLYEIPPIIRQIIQTQKVKQYYRSAKFENLMVIDKEHSPYNCGADSNNAGLNACITPVMLTIDADTILEPEALSRMMFTFLSRPNCIVVSGSLYVLNGNRVEHGRMLDTNLPKQFVPAVQSIEYLRSFLYGRAGLNVFGGAMCYPGAFTLFETEALRKVNGYEAVNFSYDCEITTKLHHQLLKEGQPYNFNHTSHAFAWTEVPSTLKSFWRQRNFWQRGMLRSLFLHIGMLFNPKYGVVGLINFPCYVLFEIFGPIVEFISYIMFAFFLWLGIIDIWGFLWFIFLAWGFITFLSITMIFLNLVTFNKYHKVSDPFYVIWLVTAEMFGFRQYRATCCFVALIHYFINRLLGKAL